MIGSRRISWFWTAFFAIAAAAAGAWGYQQHQHAANFDFASHRLALLQAENDRLQEAIARQQKEVSRDKEITARKSIEEAIVKIRGLDFREPVVYDVLTRAEIKKIIEGKLLEQYSDADFKNIAIGLSTLGLLPKDYPLKQKYIDLLGEQVAAFYDQHQHKLFMFEDASLATTQNRIILAHELTHALQDQNFGLLKMPIEIKDDDDIALAASALIEGDATVAMSDYMLQNFTLSSLRENLSGMLSQSTAQLEKSPRYLRELLIFPYLRGQEFCMALRSRGGYEAVSAAFQNPPSSTSQILHPEKYLATPREDPIRIEWPDTTAMGQKPLADNVLGELGIRILLSEWVNNPTGNTASQGWRGDRYLVFDGGKALVLKTIWSDAAAAGRFHDALVRYVGKRFPQAAVVASSPSEATFSGPSVVGSITNDERNGVVFTFGITKEWQQALSNKFKN